MTRWRPTPFLWLTGLLHLPALGLLATSAWAWGVGLLVLLHLAIMAVGLWPRSHWLGPNLTRLPEAAARRGEVAITLDDGPNPELTPRVLALLAEHGARATFFCIGRRAALYPQLCRDIVAAGHGLENHGQSHGLLCALNGPAGWRREIALGQGILGFLAGRPPRFYRAMAGLRNPFLDPVLHAMGLRLAAWTRRGFDTRDGDADRVLARLLHQLAAGDILLLHDGYCARTPAGEPVLLVVLPRLLQELRARGLRPVTLDEALRPD